MFKTIANAFQDKGVRKKLLITLLLLLVYRIGCWIPIPLLNQKFFEEMGNNSFLSLLSAVSGGSLANGAILALGVSPYITSSIIIQLLTIAIPGLERLSKEGGVEGRKKINFYTRIIALVLSIAQALGIVLAFAGSSEEALYVSASAYDLGIFGQKWFIEVLAVIMLVAGGMFTVWLGERITDLQIGNGMSLLIFVGILSTAGTAFLNACGKVTGSFESIWPIILFLIVLLLIFTFIVWLDLSERRVPVQYAKQIKGRKMYGGQGAPLPIKVNGNGVMPIIFANAILTFPQLLSSVFGWGEWYTQPWWTYTSIILTALFIFLFAFFWSQITFNTEDVSKNLQQHGGFIQGIRPGKPTAEYLGRILKYITFFGAFCLALIAFVPSIAFNIIGGVDIGMGGNTSLINAFSATGLMIVVSVALEFDKQLNAQLTMKNYKGFLK